MLRELLSKIIIVKYAKRIFNKSDSVAYYSLMASLVNNLLLHAAGQLKWQINA